jgi:hypothetical protein
VHAAGRRVLEVHREITEAAELRDSDQGCEAATFELQSNGPDEPSAESSGLVEAIIWAAAAGWYGWRIWG